MTYFPPANPDLGERPPFQDGHRDFPCSRGGLMRFFSRVLTGVFFFFFKAWIDSVLRWVRITPLGRAYSNFEFVFGIRSASSNFQSVHTRGTSLRA